MDPHQVHYQLLSAFKLKWQTKLEQPTLKREGGLRHIYNTVLNSLLRKFNHHSHMNWCDPNDTRDMYRDGVVTQRMAGVLTMGWE